MSFQNNEHNHKLITNPSLQIELSSSSSPSSTSLSYLHLKTMEEVWKDINLSSLTDNTEVDLSATTPLNPNNHTNNTNFTLQDFFSRPFARNNSQPRFTSRNIIPSAPQNVLNLNTAPSFEFSDSHDTVTSHGSPHFHNQNGSNGHTMSMNSGAGSSSNENSFDRRQKRMIKNRESAARSRRRRQVYTSELEEITRLLKEENKQLKETNRQLMKAKAVEIPEKRAMFRTYSL